MDIILQQLNPILLKHNDFKYKIIICGKNLPASYHDLSEYVSKNIIYAGFVEDINVYFKGADIFINPVTDGGGIKTKLVEALGSGMIAISTRSGAIGVPQSITGNKLIVVEDYDWIGFTNAIGKTQAHEIIPPTFFGHFYWGFIAENVAAILNKDVI